MVRFAFLEQLNSFVTHFVCTELTGLKQVSVSAVGMALFCYDTTSGPCSVSDKASGIIYESEYWIGPSAELRIHLHLWFLHNSSVVDCFVSS